MESRSRLRRYEEIVDRIGYIIEISTGSLCVLFFAAMTFVTITGVFYRYVLNDPILWSNESARFLMLWTGFLAMNIAMRKGEHIHIDIVVKWLPSWMSRALGYVVYLLIAYFLILLLVKGWAMALNTMMTGFTLSISMFWIYASVPVGALVSLIQLFLNVTAKVLSEFGQGKDIVREL
ncbi:MAG: TRAP transporter small permease [Thermodesulfobacteriota bacterium]|nr:TRAP transporter small permease [Thermodesulfobacteriota bacterium]